MTPYQKKAINDLRLKGFGYKSIANKLDLSANTVKSYCKRNQATVGMEDRTIHEDFCPNCGKVLTHFNGKKKKRFCGDFCRQKWWNSHLDKVNRKAYSQHKCLGCGLSFLSYGNQKRKFCSHSCYIKTRFGKEYL
ncbi:terminase gpP N-terminus-related DNA-binding protein [Streptococcus suis]